MMPDKILFVKWGSFSLTNENVYNIFRKEFPKMEVEVIDVDHIWRKKMGYHHYLINAWYFFTEYGKDFFYGHKKRNKMSVMSWFLGTSYISKLTDKFIRNMVKGKQYKFSFQTQGVFNAKQPGIPHFVYTDHTTQTNLLYPDINPRQYIRSDKFIKEEEQGIYDDAAKIFTCGSSITNSLITQYHIPKEKIATVYTGSNVTGVFEENDAKYMSKNILFVGIDWQRKGGPILVKAFEKILQTHPDASLTIVGCNPDINLPNVTVVGKVSKDKVAPYYNKAAVFCLPTLREPFGIVFVEAMHYKLPIVANSIGSIPDMVINDFNGYLVNNNIDDYAAKLTKLISNPAMCKQFGENGYNHAQSKFKWDIVGKAMKEQIVKHL